VRKTRCVLLAVVIAMVASAQLPPPPTGPVSINDPWPLAEAARILVARYGVPVSYEDVSRYAYSGDLADPVRYISDHPGAPTLPPRTSGVTFVQEPLKMSYDPTVAAEPAEVARILQGVLEQHEKNGNPGRFKVLETSAGLVIVPTGTRDGSGVFVPDQSLLEARISFREMEGESRWVFEAFRDALRAATGKNIMMDGMGGGLCDRIGARDEVARDVLIKLLKGYHRQGTLLGATSAQLTWNLTAYTDPASGTSYRLSFWPVMMELRDARGNTLLRRWPGH
jgi:hypothetical protein